MWQLISEIEFFPMPYGATCTALSFGSYILPLVYSKLTPFGSVPKAGKMHWLYDGRKRLGVFHRAALTGLGRQSSGISGGKGLENIASIVSTVKG
jgi:hypothetical protein